MKHELENISAKYEKVQCDLDQLMKSQANKDVLNHEHLKKEIDTLQNKYEHHVEKQNEIINVQNRNISDLSMKIEMLMNENLKLKERRYYLCDKCEFDSEIRETLLEHQHNEHRTDCDDESESEEEESPVYQCDLCDYNSGWPDSVAFHYREVHGIQMNWK